MPRKLWKGWLNRFRAKSKKPSRTQPATLPDIEDISDSTDISFRMPPRCRTNLDNQLPPTFKSSRSVNFLNDISTVIDYDSDDDYITELPAFGTDNNNNNRSDGGRSRVRHFTAPQSAISAHTYEILTNMSEVRPRRVNGRHAIQSVGIESPIYASASLLDLRSDRTGNRGYPDPGEQRSGGTHNICSLCQNHVVGSVPDPEQRPSRNEIDEDATPPISSLRSDSSDGTGLNYNPVYGPSSRSRMPAPPPPQMPQYQHQQLRLSFVDRSPSMDPLRSENFTEHHIPYYRETGFSNDAMVINISGPINIHAQNFNVNGGQLNSQDPEIAVDGLENPLPKTFYNYINHVCQRYIWERMRSPAVGEPSS